MARSLISVGVRAPSFIVETRNKSAMANGVYVAETATNSGSVVNATLRNASLSSSATITIVGNATVTLSSASLSSSGSQTIIGEVVVSPKLRSSITIGFPSPHYVIETRDKSSILPGFYLSETSPQPANVALRNATLDSSGVIGITGSLDVTLANAILTFSDTLGITGSLDVTLANATLDSTGRFASFLIVKQGPAGPRRRSIDQYTRRGVARVIFRERR